MNNLKYAIIIPARFKSSRFEGKPLVMLNGKSMIQHVWERCCEALDGAHVYVATDDERIQTHCLSFGANVIMTSESCLTGTDRLAEANQSLEYDFVINVQGDEPLVKPKDIRAVIDEYLSHPGSVINAMAKITDKNEYSSLTIPKVVASKSGRLLYMSRAAVPHSKSSHEFQASHKQICIYAFSADHLRFFASTPIKTPLENIEDIEILRFLENDVDVRMIEVESGSAAIDTPEDVDKVLKIMNS